MPTDGECLLLAISRSDGDRPVTAAFGGKAEVRTAVSASLPDASATPEASARAPVRAPPGGTP